jgi:hypothetical protein
MYGDPDLLAADGRSEVGVSPRPPLALEGITNSPKPNAYNNKVRHRIDAFELK